MKESVEDDVHVLFPEDGSEVPSACDYEFRMTVESIENWPYFEQYLESTDRKSGTPLSWNITRRKLRLVLQIQPCLPVAREGGFQFGRDPSAIRPHSFPCSHNPRCFLFPGLRASSDRIA